ncbi:MAG: hypothetical protein ACR2O4_03210 [Hyphomicrobiaceae bacterium]
MGNNDFSWAGALGAVNLFLFAWSATGATDFLAREQGVLEVTQLLLIAIAFVAFLVTALRGKGAGRTAAVALVGLCACFFYRELDLGALGVSGPLATLSKSSVRDLVLAVGVLILLGYVVLHRSDIPSWWRLATRSDAWPLFCAAILMSIGILLNATLKGDLQAQFWEELVEFNGYVLLVLAAARHSRIAAYEDVVERPIVPN